LPRSARSARSGNGSARSQNGSGRSQNRPVPAFIANVPDPEPHCASTEFLREAFPESKGGQNLRRISQDVESREGYALLDTMAMSPEPLRKPQQRPASALPRSLSMPAPNFAAAAERPATAPAPIVTVKLPEQVGSQDRPLARTMSSPVTREPKGANMFKEWKAAQSSWNQLSYIQKKMASEPGQKDMKVYLKREAQRFVHGYLKEVSPDVLYDNRTNFTPSMVAEKKRQNDRHGLHQNEGVVGGTGASTAQLQKAMKNTWVSLYGFRDDTCQATKKKELAKDFAATFRSLKPKADPFSEPGASEEAAAKPERGTRKSFAQSFAAIDHLG